jgi:hypothetical protein
MISSRTVARAAGLKRFFTGRPCKHGHLSERYVSTGSCIACLHGASTGSTPEDLRAQAAALLQRARDAERAASERDQQAATLQQRAAALADAARVKVRAWADPERMAQVQALADAYALPAGLPSMPPRLGVREAGSVMATFIIPSAQAEAFAATAADLFRALTPSPTFHAVALPEPGL